MNLQRTRACKAGSASVPCWESRFIQRKGPSKVSIFTSKPRFQSCSLWTARNYKGVGSSGWVGNWNSGPSNTSDDQTQQCNRTMSALGIDTGGSHETKGHNDATRDGWTGADGRQHGATPDQGRPPVRGLQPVTGEGEGPRQRERSWRAELNMFQKESGRMSRTAAIRPALIVLRVSDIE